MCPSFRLPWPFGLIVHQGVHSKADKEIRLGPINHGVLHTPKFTA